MPHKKLVQFLVFILYFIAQFSPFVFHDFELFELSFLPRKTQCSNQQNCKRGDDVYIKKYIKSLNNNNIDMVKLFFYCFYLILSLKKSRKYFIS